MSQTGRFEWETAEDVIKATEKKYLISDKMKQKMIRLYNEALKGDGSR